MNYKEKIHNAIYKSHALLFLRGHFGYFFLFFKNKLFGNYVKITPNLNLEVKYKLSICVRVKNEARFMPEFLAYHSVLGVEHVYIYDNNSNDELERVLDPFMKNDFLTIIRWPRVPVYPSCYIDFFEKYACYSEWVAFLDADEYIVERNYNELLQRLKVTKSASVGLNWRLFGANGHDKIPEGLVLENFTRSADKFNGHVKVIANPRKVIGLWNPHNFYYKNLSFSEGESGNIFWGTFSKPSKQPNIWINHYIHRSKEDSIKKASRGYADPQGFIQKARTVERANEEFILCNDVDNVFSPRIISEVKKILADNGYCSPYL